MKTSSNLKKFLLYQLPYIFYISFLLYWFYDTFSDDRTINYIAMGLAMVIFVQFVFQNTIAGVSMGIIGMLVSSFFFFHLQTISFIIILFSFLMGLLITITNLKKKIHRKAHT